MSDYQKPGIAKASGATQFRVFHPNHQFELASIPDNDIANLSTSLVNMCHVRLLLKAKILLNRVDAAFVATITLMPLVI